MKNRIILFGASTLGECAYKLLGNKYHVAFFCDNNQEKWGSYFQGIKVISPAELKNMEDCEVIITSSHYLEISKQLLDMGITCFKRFSYTLTNNYVERITKESIDYELHGNQYGRYAIYGEYIDEKSIVYSFGVGEDISFDLSIINKFKSQVYAFDPTPRSIKWIREQKTPKNFHFFPFGISDSDGEESFYYPDKAEHVSCSVIENHNQGFFNAKVFCLETIMKQLKHKKIDILKLDIEGAEYKVLDNIIKNNIAIAQLVLEFHHRFKNIGWEKTESAIKSLNNAGYKLFYVSDSEEEFSFMKLKY